MTLLVQCDECGLLFDPDYEGVYIDDEDAVPDDMDGWPKIVLCQACDEKRKP